MADVIGDPRIRDVKWPAPELDTKIRYKTAQRLSHSIVTSCIISSYTKYFISNAIVVTDLNEVFSNVVARKIPFNFYCLKCAL